MSWGDMQGFCEHFSRAWDHDNIGVGGMDSLNTWLQASAPTLAITLLIILLTGQVGVWVWGHLYRSAVADKEAAQAEAKAWRTNAQLGHEANREVVTASISYDRAQLSRIRNVIRQYLSETEVRELCYDLKLNYEDLGAGFREAVGELVAELERQQRVIELVRWIGQKRPDVWEMIVLWEPKSGSKR